MPGKAKEDLNSAIDIYEQLLISVKKSKIKILKLQLASANNLLGLLHHDEGNYPEALKFYRISLNFFLENGQWNSAANNFHNIGIVYDDQGNYPSALMNYQKSLAIYSALKSNVGIASSYNNIAIVYDNLGDYPMSLKIHLKALKLRESIGDSIGILDSYNGIGNVYLIIDHYPEALKNYEASLEIAEKMGDDFGRINGYNNIADVYTVQKKYSEALKNYLISFEIAQSMHDQPNIANYYTNIGIIHFEQGNYEEAFKDFQEALRLKNILGERQAMASLYNNLGKVLLKQKKYVEANNSFSKGLNLATEIGSTDDLKDSHRYLATLDSIEGRYASSLHHYQDFISFRDKLFNEENTEKLVRTQLNYDFNKKELKAIAEQEKKDAISKEELRRQKLVRNGFVLGFLVVLLFALIFFGQRNRIKKGKILSDSLLLNILPSEVAEELKMKGSADAKQFDEVTVMFTDFKGFTQISEKLSPKELVAEIHQCFMAFDNIITQYKIEKIKTIGDAYMAAGGLSTSDKSEAKDVVNAALDIQQFMYEYNEKKKAAGELFFEVRIGIHTGPVVAGIVGIKKFAYDIWGDTVNTASRMESSGETGKVNVSGACFELIKNEFKTTYRGKLQAKNKGEIDMYFVEREA